jgi:hypothetical protein
MLFFEALVYFENLCISFNQVCICLFNNSFQNFHFIDLLQEFIDFCALDALGLLEEAFANGGLCASGGVGEGKLGRSSATCPACTLPGVSANSCFGSESLYGRFKGLLPSVGSLVCSPSNCNFLLILFFLTEDDSIESLGAEIPFHFL